MWCYTIVLILAVVSAVRLSPDKFECSPAGYLDYVKEYELFKGEEHRDEETEAVFIATCNKMKDRASYVRYQQEFTILSDFTKDTLDQLMDQSALVYAGLGSYYDGATHEGEEKELTWTTMDRVFEDAEDVPYSLAKNFEGVTEAGQSTSWATTTIKAAEKALEFGKVPGVKLSWRYLFECIYGDNPDDSYKKEGVPPKDIIEFIREKGLVTEDAIIAHGSIDCGYNYENAFLFNVEEAEGPNKYALMNLIDTENPTIALMAIDLHKIKYVANMTNEEYPVRCSYDEPTLYGIVKGYKNTEDYDQEGWWSIETNVVPGESVYLRIPLIANRTNANYAGIAAYAFSILYDGPVPTTEAPVTEIPTTEVPTTEVPTTEAPTTEAPTTEAPTTEAPTTEAPTTEAPTTEAPTTEAPTTEAPTTEAPTTEAPTTEPPTTEIPTTVAPTDLFEYKAISCFDIQTLNEYQEGVGDNGHIGSIVIDLQGGQVCEDYDALDFTRYFWVESLKIINAPSSILPNLKHITIGNEKLKIVTLSNIGQQDNDELIEGSALVFKKSINLEEIEITDNAFQHFENFTLGENPEENEENFPKLKSIKFGKSGRYEISRSYMFSNTPFVLANLPSLEEVVMSAYTFYSTNSVLFDNLPKLKSLYLGNNAFYGSLVEAELTMLNVGTEYYSTELKKTQMTVSANTFNSQVTVYLKGMVSNGFSMPRYSY